MTTWIFRTSYRWNSKNLQALPTHLHVVSTFKKRKSVTTVLEESFSNGASCWKHAALTVYTRDWSVPLKVHDVHTRSAWKARGTSNKLIQIMDLIRRKQLGHFANNKLECGLFPCKYNGICMQSFTKQCRSRKLSWAFGNFSHDCNIGLQ